MALLRFINGHIGRWLFPLLILAAGFTRHGGGYWHQCLGLGALLFALLRIVEGFVGVPEARFALILRGTRAIAANLRSVIRGTERQGGVNAPLRGLLLVIILGAMVLTAGTGVLLTTPGLWSVRWIALLHALAAFLLFVSSALYGSIYILAKPIKRGV